MSQKPSKTASSSSSSSCGYYCLSITGFIAVGIAIVLGLAHQSLMKLHRNGDVCKKLSLGQEDPSWQSRVESTLPQLYKTLEKFSTARAKGELDDPNPQGIYKRVQHPQDWGCLENVRVELDGGGKGAFAKKGTYKGTIRLSKNSFDPDNEPKVSSIALKIHGLSMSKRAMEDDETDTQDFTMVSTDNLALCAVPEDLITLHEKLISGGLVQAILWILRTYPTMLFYLLPSIIRGIFITTPFAAKHYTVHAYSWGPDMAVKFGLFPCNDSMSMPPKEGSGKDFVYATTEKFLNNNEGCLKLMIQKQTDSCKEQIDDIMTPWATPFTPIGKVIVPKGSKLIRGDKCENLVMNPWHTADETKPVGWVARIRKDVYITQSKYRKQKNGVE
jgi:hypothetical protein